MRKVAFILKIICDLGILFEVNKIKYIKDIYYLNNTKILKFKENMNKVKKLAIFRRSKRFKDMSRI